MWKYILFDLDGTITNSGEGIMNCIRYALEQMGREIPAEQTLRKFVGPPLVVGFREYTDDCYGKVPGALSVGRSV